jgi:hypothetical protein
MVYLESESHVCTSAPAGAALYFGSSLSLPARLMLFGALAGVAWAVVPWFLIDMIRPPGQAVTAFASGAMTGALVALLLAFPLRQSGPAGTLLVGVLSYPLGAFIFGFVTSIVHLLVSRAFGVEYRFVESGFAPVRVGLSLAGYAALFWPFPLILVPLALWTTYQLKRVIESPTLQ